MRMSKAFGPYRESKLMIGASSKMADSVISRISAVGGEGAFKKKNGDGKSALSQINAIEEDEF